MIDKVEEGRDAALTTHRFAPGDDDELLSSVGRPRRPIDDPFFHEGDRFVWNDAEGAILCFTGDPSNENFENEDDRTQCNAMEDSNSDQESIDQAKTHSYSKQVETFQFPCGFCDEAFTTLIQCEKHYDQRHRFECQICKADESNTIFQTLYCYPTERLLELHLMESHDSYFAASLEKGLVSYVCLEPDCDQAFQTDRQRQFHLVESHGYPRWFRFHSHLRRHPRRTYETNLPSSIKEGKNLSASWQKKKSQWLKHHGTKIDDAKDQPSSLLWDTSKTYCNASTDATSRSIMPQEEKKRRRRERQKAKRATIPCKFFATPEGCWRGDSCMFLHSINPDRGSESHEIQSTTIGHQPKVTEIERPSADSVNTEMDDVSQRFASVALVPNKVRFGRKRR